MILLGPMFVLLPRLAGRGGLWGAIPSSELLTLTIIVAVYLVTRRRGADSRG
ncbi:MAG: hypothetical protein K2J28_02450 [Duncaniella sp.]|nr:hypothetical protein [Duncaniella sp.]